MTYETISDKNTSEGLHVLLTYVNEVTNGLFSEMMLFGVFIIVLLGIYFSQQRTTGRGDFMSAFAISGFFVVGLALIMSMIPGMVKTIDIVVTIAIAIIGVAGLWLSRASD